MDLLKTFEILKTPLFAIVLINLVILFFSFLADADLNLIWFLVIVPMIVLIWAGFKYADAVNGGFIAGAIGGTIISIIGFLIQQLGLLVFFPLNINSTSGLGVPFFLITFFISGVFAILSGAFFGCLGGFIAKAPVGEGK